MPEIEISMMAILVTVVATFFVGFIWYTPLFGKAWAKEMGMDPDIKPEMSAMLPGMIVMLVGNFLLAWVLSHNMAVWDPETWGQGPSEMSAAANAGMAALFTWLGFYFPVDIGTVFWEKKSWKLFGINTGYHFVMLLVAAMIIAHM